MISSKLMRFRICAQCAYFGMLQEYEVLSLLNFNSFVHKRKKMPKHLFSKSQAKKATR